MLRPPRRGYRAISNKRNRQLAQWFVCVISSSLHKLIQNKLVTDFILHIWFCQIHCFNMKTDWTKKIQPLKTSTTRYKIYRYKPWDSWDMNICIRTYHTTTQQCHFFFKNFFKPKPTIFSGGQPTFGIQWSDLWSCPVRVALSLIADNKFKSSAVFTLSAWRLLCISWLYSSQFVVDTVHTAILVRSCKGFGISVIYIVCVCTCCVRTYLDGSVVWEAGTDERSS